MKVLQQGDRRPNLTKSVLQKTVRIETKKHKVHRKKKGKNSTKRNK